MKKDDLVFLIGMMLEELGGEFQISPDSQMDFSKGMTNKEMLFNEDPLTRIITLKLVNKEEVKELIEEN